MIYSLKYFIDELFHQIITFIYILVVNRDIVLAGFGKDTNTPN